MFPSFEDYKKITKDNLGKYVVFYKEIEGDMETPISIYQKLCSEKDAYLLESSDGVGKTSRYSFIGYDLEFLETDNNNEDPLEKIKASLNEKKPLNKIDYLPFYGGYAGYLSYDLVKYYEKIPKAAADDLNLPDVRVAMADKLICYDHKELRITIIIRKQVTGEDKADYENAEQEIKSIEDKIHMQFDYKFDENDLNDVHEDLNYNSNISQEKYIENVEKAKEYIKAGDIFQVVLSQRFKIKTFCHPFKVYRRLRVINPSPYMYYLNFDDVKIVGSSPEMLVKVSDKKVQTCPIAGTRKRGKNDEEDKALMKDLKNDEKECAEHLMLVDLGRNDIGRVSKLGTVKTDNIMHIEKYSHVMHMVSEVEGELADDKDGFDAVRSCLPAGTVSGAPKIRAMEIIDELEVNKRGIYSGAIGYFSYDGNVDTCITIRTIIFKGNYAYMQAGGGIVYDSIPINEFNETLNKLEALRCVLNEVNNK